MRRKTNPGRTQHGFVLVLTLWVMAIVAIAATYFSEKVSDAVALAQRSRQNAQTSIDLAASRAEILYRLASTSLTVDGLGHGNTVIALDNRPYRAIGDTMVRVQDSRGLLNLNQTPDDRLARFLGLVGIPPEHRNHLVDTLRDYIDADKLERLNGAEEPQYLARGLPAPTNNALATPWEVRRIIGWRDAPQLWANSNFIDLTTTSTVLGLNPNTAPAEVLATLPGVTDDLAKALITRRQQSPILHAGELAALAGIPEQWLDMQIMVIPGDTLRVTQSASGVNWGLQYSVTLTPNSDTGPWRIDYMSRVAITPATTASNALPSPTIKPVDPALIPLLPQRSTAAPDRPPAISFGG